MTMRYKDLSIEEEKRILLELWRDYKSRSGEGGTNITTDNIEEVLQASPTIGAKANATDLATLASKVPVFNHGTSDTTLTLLPNQFHIWGEVASLTLTLGTPEEGVYNEYMFEFVSGATPTTLSLPSTIKWQDDLEVEANMKYQVSIVNNIGLIAGVETV